MSCYMRDLGERRQVWSLYACASQTNETVDGVQNVDGLTILVPGCVYMSVFVSALVKMKIVARITSARQKYKCLSSH